MFTKRWPLEARQRRLFREMFVIPEMCVFYMRRTVMKCVHCERLIQTCIWMQRNGYDKKIEARLSKTALLVAKATIRNPTCTLVPGKCFFKADSRYYIAYMPNEDWSNDAPYSI